MSLEGEFHAASLEAVDECRRLGYVPTAWVAMMQQPGGATAAAKRVLMSGDIQSGLERLMRIGREDLTVEHAVLSTRWTELFSDAHRAAAQWRLDQART